MSVAAPAVFEETQSFPFWIYGLMALALVIVLSIVSMRQVTRVEPGAVSVRLGFVYSTTIPTSDIRLAEAVKYRPIREYGGWGIRGRSRRRVISTRGDLGVLLTRSDGTTLMIGSQRPRELLRALAQAGVKTEDRLPPVTQEF